MIIVVHFIKDNVRKKRYEEHFVFLWQRYFKLRGDAA